MNDKQSIINFGFALRGIGIDNCTFLYICADY